MTDRTIELRDGDRLIIILAKTSRGGGESRPAPKGATVLSRKAGNASGFDSHGPAVTMTTQGAGVAPGPRETKSRSSDPASRQGHGANRKPDNTHSGQPHNAGASTKPKVGRPRIEDRDRTLSARKPWAALGMSESTWRRRQA